MRINGCEKSALEEIDVRIYKDPVSEKHRSVILEGCDLPKRRFNVSGKYFK